MKDPGSPIPKTSFVSKPEDGYHLLPFRFDRIADDRYVATNIAGEFVFLSIEELKSIVKREGALTEKLFNTLKSKHFLFDETSRVSIDLLSAKYRTRLSRLPQLASLHIFVTTRRCNHTCTYCQVNSKGVDHSDIDMSLETARHAVDFMFGSYAPCLKVEFQGGEPLLNFDCVKYITETSRERAEVEGRDVEFVLCTNLSLLSNDVIQFCKEHRVYISTSLDGPESVHNANRIMRGGNSYRCAVEGISRCREELGVDYVSALMTTTRQSLDHPRAIVDEYIRQGFSSLFVRSLNPYGQSSQEDLLFAYSLEEWISFYHSVLDYIISLNRTGFFFREDLTSILLQRALTNNAGGFVDLQSPTGAGTAVIVYDHNGKVFASDESRMLAAMGDDTFCLGNVFEHSYDDVLGTEFYVNLLTQTMLEGVPWCVDCAFQPYCGADPVRHYRDQKDFVGHKATSQFCRKQRNLLTHLFNLMAVCDDILPIFERWV